MSKSAVLQYGADCAEELSLKGMRHKLSAMPHFLNKPAVLIVLAVLMTLTCLRMSS